MSDIQLAQTVAAQGSRVDGLEKYFDRLFTGQEEIRSAVTELKTAVVSNENTSRLFRKGALSLITILLTVCGALLSKLLHFF